jgi:hypothetical protein
MMDVVYQGNKRKFVAVKDESRIEWYVGRTIFARCLSLPKLNISESQRVTFQTRNRLQLPDVVFNVSGVGQNSGLI